MNLTSLILFVMIIICIILLPGALIPNYHHASKNVAPNNYQ